MTNCLTKKATVFATATVLLGTMTLLPASAESSTAPADLHSKSIVVSWAENRVQRHVGEPNFRPVNANQTMSIYISSAGRVFSRLNLATGAGTGSAERIQGDQKQSPMFRPWEPTFGDKSMTLSQPFQKGGMRKLSIDFDAGLTGCKAKVAYVKDEGAQTSLAWSPITKKMVEFQSIAMIGESCAIKAGNVFGNE